MKGIILAAGKGTRLYPATKTVCKPLVPVYDKPLIYYPLSVLIQAGIKDVLIIVPPDDLEQFEKLFGDGRNIGINIRYKEQKVQRGIADAFIIGESFIGNDSVCLILGDNIFYGRCMKNAIEKAISNNSGAAIFGLKVEDPRPFGVVEFDKNGKAISIEEKPEKPKSDYIVPGLYFYDNEVVKIAKNLKPSARGELEITGVNDVYLKRGKLNVIALENLIWLDAGTADSLLEASNIVCKTQKSHDTNIACIEYEAYKKGYITLERLKKIGESMEKTSYGKYILNICEKE
jgi:glucose-1-phosphate thymidylyltransferase